MYFQTGKQRGTYHRLDIPEGEYITEIKWRRGKYLDAIKFCLSNGYCTPRWGGGGGGAVTTKFDNSIINFWRMSGKRETLFSPWVVSNLHSFFYETNRVEKVVLGDDITFNPAADPFVEEILDESGVRAIENCGNVSSTLSVDYSITASSGETATVSTVLDGDYTLEFPESATFLVSAIDPGTGSPIEYVIGNALFERPDFRYESLETFSGSFDLMVQPKQHVEAAVVYHEFMYDYHWKASAFVHFADGREVELLDFQGRVYGTRVMPPSVKVLNVGEGSCA